MIVSFVRGRIRARLTHLKGQDVPHVPAAGALKGVKTLAVNPLTGGVLLEYDPEIISVEEIASFLEPLDPEGAATLRNPWLLRPQGLFARAVEVPPELLSGEAREAAIARRPRPRGSARATSETINLATAFLSCVASAFWGSVRTHTLCGAGLGLLIAQHVWRHRRHLRPLGQMGLLEILGIELPKLIGPPQTAMVEEPEPDGEAPEGS